MQILTWIFKNKQIFHNMARVNLNEIENPKIKTTTSWAFITLGSISSKIKIPLFRLQFMKFSNTSCYKVNLAGQSSHSEVFSSIVWSVRRGLWPQSYKLHGRHSRFLAGKDAIVAATSSACRRCRHLFLFLKIQPRTRPWLPCLLWRHCGVGE